MPDTKISQDPTATTLTGAEIFPLIQDTLNKKCTVSSLITDSLIVRAYLNTDGSYSLQLPNSTFLESITPVYALPGITISGADTLPNANTFDTGSVVRLHKDNFVGSGANQVGVELWADSLNNVWRPYGTQRLGGASGNLASPIATLSASGKFNIGTDPVIPAGLLLSDSHLIIKMSYRKVGVTTPVVRINLGTDMSTQNNNSLVYTQTVAAGAGNRDISLAIDVNFISSTAAFSSNRSQIGAGGADGQFWDLTTLIDTTADMKLTFEASTLSSDTVNLISYEILWSY